MKSYETKSNELLYKSIKDITQGVSIPECADMSIDELAVMVDHICGSAPSDDMLSRTVETLITCFRLGYQSGSDQAAKA